MGEYDNDDEEVPLTLQEKFDKDCPIIDTMEAFEALVLHRTLEGGSIARNEPECYNLTVVFAIAPSYCAHSRKLMEEGTLASLSSPIPQNKHANFYRVNLETCDAGILLALSEVSKTPSLFTVLKGISTQDTQLTGGAIREESASSWSNTMAPAGTPIEPISAVYTGSNIPKLQAIVKNNIIKRNEVMQEYDEERLEALRAEQERENEEKEEEEENEDSS